MRILENIAIARDIYRLRLAGDTSAVTAPGQFLNIAVPGFFLRRPISVCDWDERGATVIYKVVGGGTEALSRMREGELDCLCGLGNGFSLPEGIQAPVLIGGGVGVPPLYGLCRRLVARGTAPTVVLGFETRADMFYADEFRALGAAVVVCTRDGSAGVKGLVTDALPSIACDYSYACGPEGMLRAAYHALACPGEYSFEARMACGFGACMGCSCRTVTGYKRICKDGPVLMKEEILW